MTRERARKHRVVENWLAKCWERGQDNVVILRGAENLHRLGVMSHAELNMVRFALKD